MVNLGEWVEEDEAAEAAESENQQPQPNGATVPNGTSDFFTINGDGDGPLDRLAETAEWEDILVHGAQWETAKPQDRETLKAFKRPGGTYDISAKVLKANPHVLVVHSDAAGLPYGKRAETNQRQGVRPPPLQRRPQGGGASISPRHSRRATRPRC
jgi:hypothetical protein